METSINNKCKAFTSLEQSKKLAEILPLESANMCYRILPGIKEDMPAQYIAIVPDDAFFESDIPAWSLAALLGVLPYGYSSILTKSFNGKDYYCEIDGKPLETKADNPVDACVAMIEKLHELKIL